MRSRLREDSFDRRPKYVARLFRDIHDNLALLDEVREEGRELFDAQRVRRYGVQYALIAVIEAVIALGHHLIAECGFPAPERNVDLVSILVREGVVTNLELAENLPKMVRFRNLLVHRYWQVESETVWTVLEQRLDDVRHFCSEVDTFLSEHQSDSTD